MLSIVICHSLRSILQTRCLFGAVSGFEPIVYQHLVYYQFNFGLVQQLLPPIMRHLQQLSLRRSIFADLHPQKEQQLRGAAAKRTHQFECC
jgi:hypothetical protein